jgi:two-component system, OmpR family, sensor histidine kinase BaeS
VTILQATTEAFVGGMTEPTPANLGSLNAEVMRLVRMVDGLQRLAAAVSAGIQLRLDRHDLAEIAAEVAARLRDAFASAEVTLSTELEPAVALCDRDRIQDVVGNLLTNALKFTPDGGRVTVQTGRDGDHEAFVLVSDTGIGIPADELPRVTQRFFRSRRSAGMASGSGLGMAIVSALVRSHHGHLDISSEEGQGTQVTVTLPTTGI